MTYNQLLTFLIIYFFVNIPQFVIVIGFRGVPDFVPNSSIYSNNKELFITTLLQQ